MIESVHLKKKLEHLLGNYDFKTLILFLGCGLLWFGTLFINYRYTNLLIRNGIGQIHWFITILVAAGLHLILVVLIVLIYEKVRKQIRDGISGKIFIRSALIMGIIFLSIVSFYTTYKGTKIIWSEIISDPSEEIIRLLLSAGIQTILLAVAISFSFFRLNILKILGLAFIYILVASVSIYFNFYFFYQQIAGVTNLDEQRDTIKRDYADFLNQAKSLQENRIVSLQADSVNNRSIYQAKRDSIRRLPDSVRVRVPTPFFEYNNKKDFLEKQINSYRALEPKFSQAKDYIALVDTADTIPTADLQRLNTFFLNFMNELKGKFPDKELPLIKEIVKKTQHPFLQSIDFFFNGIFAGNLERYATKIAWTSFILAVVVDVIIFIAGFMMNRLLRKNEPSTLNEPLDVIHSTNRNDVGYLEPSYFEIFSKSANGFWKKYPSEVQQVFASRLGPFFKSQEPITHTTLETIERDKEELRLFNDFCKYGLVIMNNGKLYLNHNNPYLGDFLADAQ